jgi:hypothetical protein
MTPTGKVNFHGVAKARFGMLNAPLGACPIPVGQGQTRMYGPPLCRKRKTKVTGWSAQMYPAFVEHKLLALDGMRCALVLLSNAALEGIFLFTGFESAGFDRCVIS